MNISILFDDFCFIFQINEDPRTEALRKLSYGFVIPTICALGIIGNVLNLIVLTRRNMRGTAYIYMRGKFNIFWRLSSFFLFIYLCQVFPFCHFFS